MKNYSNYQIKDNGIFDNPEISDRYRMFNKGQMIYQQGEESPCVYYLKRGKVKIYMPSKEGNDKILAVLGEGSLFGKASFFNKTVRSSSAQTLEACNIIMIDENIMKAIIKSHPEFAIEMIQHLSGTIRMLSVQINSMAFLKADAKIAGFLYEQYEAGSGKYIEITHEEIAQNLNLSRVTVSRILSRFSKIGFVSTEYGSICVHDVDKLIEYAYTK